MLENDPLFNAGTGSHLNRLGKVELDASIMEGDELQAGAVAAVERIRNPVLLARAVLEQSEHVLLVGKGARRFAREHGLPECRARDLLIGRMAAKLAAARAITYAAAMQKGWSTADVLWDVPIKLDVGEGQFMTPVNYDGRYRGPVLFRDALANSYNIPPIQLLRDIGIPAFIQMARGMGIESLDETPGFYGLSITLGGGEVPLLELSHAFATLANGGQKPHLTSVLQITDSRGSVIYDVQRDRVPPVKALDERIAYIITDILDDDDARVPAMGRGNALELPFPAAAKTGTTNDFRDAWTVGYTPGLVVGVWLGNADGHPMNDLPGLRGAAPVWNRIMTDVYADPELQRSLMVNGRPPSPNFTPPGGIEGRKVCLPRGTGGSQCTATRDDLFLVNAPRHGIPRVQYNTNPDANPGAWTLITHALAAEDAQRVQLTELDDGTKPAVPRECVVNSNRVPVGGTTRLYLQIPPHYPDEVRARLWARGTGFRMAPATVCPMRSLDFPDAADAQPAPNNSIRESSGAPAAAPASGNYYILSPSAGSQVNGIVRVHGTAMFEPTQVDHFQVEIGAGASPAEWQPVGEPGTLPVSNGTLAQFEANGFPPGAYTLRLLLVGQDGSPVGEPHEVPIKIGP
jgi:hypothetical protein